MTKGKSNTKGASGPARSGGGITSNKLVKVTTVHGSRDTKMVAPTAAAHIGRSVGNHASEAGGKTLQRPNVPLYKPTRDAAPLGNEVAKNVGRGAPGAGRILHGQSGSQGQHGPANQGSPMPGQGGPGGPAGFGFKGPGR
jgi:hypothetical protein